MALQTSGPISLANVQTEFGGSAPTSISEYYGADTGVPSSGAISLGDFYGKSDEVAPPPPPPDPTLPYRRENFSGNYTFRSYDMVIGFPNQYKDAYTVPYGSGNNASGGGFSTMGLYTEGRFRTAAEAPTSPYQGVQYNAINYLAGRAPSGSWDFWDYTEIGIEVSGNGRVAKWDCSNVVWSSYVDQREGFAKIEFMSSAVTTPKSYQPGEASSYSGAGGVGAFIAELIDSEQSVSIRIDYFEVA